MSDNIEHRAFWGIDADGDIALPYTGWYTIENILQHQKDISKRIQERRDAMTNTFSGEISEADLKRLENNYK